jgi:hypothetical protein
MEWINECRTGSGDVRQQTVGWPGRNGWNGFGVVIQVTWSYNSTDSGRSRPEKYEIEKCENVRRE